MKLKKILKGNLLLKITSLNAIVIIVRLLISLFIQRMLAISFGEIGIAKIGQLRNLIQIITSTSSFGSFNGVVKYVSEFRDNNEKLKGLFNTIFVFCFVGSVLTSIIIIVNASWITYKIFGDLEFLNVIRLLALFPFIIGVNRVFQGVINGLSEYKKYAKIDLISYSLSITLLLICLYFYDLKGVLFSIILTPIIQFGTIVYILGLTLKEYIKIKNLEFKLPFAKEILAFALMSFVSTILLNYIELDIRTMITNKISINEAGYWTSINFISKNYMLFSSGIFTLYVIPKFARIYDGRVFRKEVFFIFKTILPLFALGMFIVYLFRIKVIDIVYPNFLGMEPLFKWQLLGDFIRLASLVLAHQFLAKKMVKTFIITEIISLGLFYFLAQYLVGLYGVEGIVMAHFYRYLVYFCIVIFSVWNYFRQQKSVKED